MKSIESFRTKRLHITSITSSSAESTVEIGSRIAALCPKGTTVCLTGQLGAGKTQFVKGFGKAIGVDPESVTSPTFTIATRLEGATPINHVDLYRVVDDDEFDELGLHEHFAAPEITLIEWGERYLHRFPRDFLWIEFVLEPSGARRIELYVIGAKLAWHDQLARLSV
jgi:tRNA threonylcarbamoyladenosine biosynthesis protein TsaE